MEKAEKLHHISTQVRRDILRMIHSAKSGHPGGSLGCADLITSLFFEIMDHNSNFSVDGKNEDIFFLSNGHVCPAFYSVLARSGYFDIAELATFRQLNSRVQGHPATDEGLPGIRIASGSLGQGLSVAVGAALTKKLNNDNHLVFAQVSDGEIQEGQNWEAMMFAAHHKVDNLIVVFDHNNIQIDGTVDDVLSIGKIKDKWLSFGWKVFEMNGHDINDILKVVSEAKMETKKGVPVVIIMKTVIGKGVDFMENDNHWHGVPPNDEELATALSQLEETLGDY